MARPTSPTASGRADTADAAPSTDDELLTIEQLSEVSGVPARTIRYYQAEKLLEKPERDRRDGRVARYGRHHLERLRLVGELRDRGLKLPAIRSLLQEADASAVVADWLGLDETLRGSWGHDEARIVSRSDLAAMTEGTPPGTLGQLEDAGLVVRQGDAWLVPSPALLEVTIKLVTDGVDVHLVIEAGDILHRHLGRAARELIELFIEARSHGFGTGIETAPLVEALRPTAGDAARIIFGLQLERAIDALLADTDRLRKR